MYNPDMRRTNIYFDDDLDESLCQEAALEGRSTASVVRDAVRAYLQERARARRADPFRALIGAYSSEHTDSALRHDRYLYGEDLDAERGD